MSTEQQLQRLNDEVQSIVESISKAPSVSGADLRRVLKFLAKVVQVVDQAFRDVYALLIELKYMTVRDVKSGRVRELLKELDLLKARDRYRDAEQICSRLHSLSEQYESEIKPILQHIGNREDWYQLFMLIDEHEGRIIELVDRTIWEFHNMLSDNKLDESNVRRINLRASQVAEATRQSLDELGRLQNKILGLSGEVGILELTATNPADVEREVNIFFDHSNRSITQNVAGQGNQAAIGVSVSQTKESPMPRSPWISGSFYLAAMVVIGTLFLVVANTVPFLALPVVIVGAMLAVSLVGAFQLRQDKNLSEKNFIALMLLTFKQLPFVRKENTNKDTN